MTKFRWVYPGDEGWEEIPQSNSLETELRASSISSRRWSAAWKRAAKKYRYYQLDKLVTDLYEEPVIRGLGEQLVEARLVARRLLRERDEARRELSKATLWDDDNEEAWKNLSALCETQTATIQHLESDRDALAAENARLRAEIQEWRNYEKSLRIT